jgi:hypothetical protein
MLTAWVATLGPGLTPDGATAAPSGDATDLIAFRTPFPDDTRPLVTLVQTVTWEGRVSPLCTILGMVRVHPVPVAGRVLVQAQPLEVGSDENDVPDTVGNPLAEETTWAVPLAGGEATPLPPDGILSPSGQRYAFWRFNAVEEASRLWVKSGEEEQPSSLYRAVDAGFLEWSPDEHFLAVGGFPEPEIHGQQMMVVETETFAAAFECKRADAARWSPDGEELAYLVWEADAEGKHPQELRVWNRESGEVSTLAKVPGKSYFLLWSPDGKRLLFGVSRWKEGEFLGGEVWVAEREGNAVRRLDPAGVAEPLAWTVQGESCWVRGKEESLQVVSLQSASAQPLLSVATGPESLKSQPAGAAVERVAGGVRDALAGVARANQAVESFCEDLAAPQRELTQAEKILRGLPEVCPEARLLPAQCEEYAQAVAQRREELPIAACLVRMRRIGMELALYFIKHNALPPDAPAGLKKDPRYWLSPGTDPRQPYKIQYRLASGGTPRTDQVILECGPLGDRMVRLRWPEKVTGFGPSTRYIQPPEPRVEPLGR